MSSACIRISSRGFLISIIGIAYLTSSAMGQASTSEFRTLVSVMITITSGNFDPLKPQLSAFVDGSPAEIQKAIPAGDQPLIFSLLVDASGSSRDREVFEKKMAFELFKKLGVGGNLGFFGYFNGDIHIGDNPATIAMVATQLNALTYGGGSPLRDAVLESAKLVNRNARDARYRRAVIVITDGQDLNSKHSLADLIPELQQQEVPIFCVGLIGPPGNQAAAKSELRNISESSGGAAHLLEEQSDVVKQLVRELDSEYRLVISASELAGPGPHSLELRSRDKHLKFAAPPVIP